MFFLICRLTREKWKSLLVVCFFFILSFPLLLPVLQFSFSLDRSVNHATKPLSKNIKYVYCHVVAATRIVYSITNAGDA